MSTTLAPSTSYTIDKTHSEAVFQVRHLVTRVRGRFTDFSGTVQFDEAHVEQSKVALTINAASIDTGTADRDTHLKSDDFFAVDKFPTVTFVSSRIVKKDAERFDVVGTFTIRDVSKEITVPVTFLGNAKDPWGNLRAGFEGEITVNRKDYGLAWNATLETGGFLVGDEVKITVSIQAIAQK
ncbi:MAG TPA: YceI family protein [Vicinamibacterales bacterium]